MRAATLSLVLLWTAAIFGCVDSAPAQMSPAQERSRAEVVEALDALASELAADRPADADAYVERLRDYLDAHPAFYGSAVALLDKGGRVTASPYVYRASGGYATLDLATPSYGIESQAWVTEPLAANMGVWTDPYFDAGGGEIWMVTRSVPVRDGENVFALVTTDLPVEAPAR